MGGHNEKIWTDDPRERLRVTAGFRLADVDPGGTPGFAGVGQKNADAALDAGVGELSNLQEMLFANSRSGDPLRVLLVLQAMDTAGKGGIVRHVVGSVDPQGVRLSAFKAPTEEERAHDFLWRVRRRLPEVGLIGVFDRSHYEDVLVGRVRALASPAEIEDRYEKIRQFENELVGQGTTIIKVMLHIGSDDQKERLAERLERPDKHWKYNPGDVDERMRWDAYMDAYQIALERTSTSAAPWFVVPAEKKWYARLVVQHLLIDALQRLDLTWPAATFDVAQEKARLAAT
ncbi:polyphosphate kinase 2 family protein [Cryobacterium sp. TMT1-21]|uniref:Polyphosphate kinase 2 family protein n=1 Tax=Cryobacterium shii TaxID=1259235 RepID=A0AAQ2C5Q6_9MICO|nr:MULTISPECIES: PPK2 family polyphosphate kinase [Cryobacterium]TFC45601.1 polyphosphate kinase 2 family protein [Cryobacterium shii]TFC85791.1 polyphosphate kinase 2 family protein [Cryobacterium sp. TmT2-59]TFD16468.1 polyphosphate kinase 2 family protein [Cryobacterium sp. TMT1-21]TFD16916.1 polyphosphate kinase 2 family protein [Cryobacterium sp. TMT4-10]TFD23592.1 polyphosphate kinase 2 family protein [Cryobacterium sp. TMT2-23]